MALDMFLPHKQTNGGGTKYRESKTPFRKQLRWLIDNPTETSVVMEITPAMAEEMLRHNVDEEGGRLNRSLSRGSVSNWAETMRAGKWLHTGQPIIFGKSGRLIDGQHRLEAVVEAGVSVFFDVRFGIEDRCFSVIDIGRKRTASDVFSIYGVPYYAVMSAATRWAIMYDSHDIDKRQSGYRGWQTPEELYRAYLDIAEGLQASAHIASVANASRLGPPAMFVAFHYLCARKHRKKADIFFDQVLTGANLSTKNAPAARLRQKVIGSLADSRRIEAGVLAAYLVQAWNAERGGRKIGLFKWRDEQNANQPFPRIR